VLGAAIRHGDRAMARAARGRRKNTQPRRAIALAGRLAGALTIGLLGCRSRSAPVLIWEGGAGTRTVEVSAIASLLAPRGPGIRSAPWGDSRDATFQLLELTAAESPHVHERHDLTIVVLRGSGVLYAGGRRYEVAAGDVVHIARGVPHHFHPAMSQPTVGLGIFVPRLDGNDSRPAPE
jgi:mannose-6-phosphate isomerase-like protein (cupin superfamily)